MKIFELFAGIGAVRKAFINISIPFESVGISEIDKYAVQSYNALYGETKNYGDITKIDISSLPNFDMLIYGFPCQDISVAGLQKGMDEGSGTRSSLLWFVIDIIKEKRPKYLLMENVKNLIGKNNIDNFKKYLSILEGLGYQTTYKVMDAAHFDVPQHRERLICFSTLNEKPKELPDGVLTFKCVNDILDEVPKEKYFLNVPFIPIEYPLTINGLRRVGEANMKGQDILRRVYDVNGVCPTLTTMGGGNTQPKFLFNGRIRKLSPEECWRVMGFSNEDIKKVRDIGMSDTQMYKQIGNSICVSMLESVLKAQLGTP